MKEIFLLTFLSSLALSFIPSRTFNFRSPGTVEIVDNFYFDDSEVSNIAWKEYVSSLRETYGENSAVYKNALPQDSVWIINGLYNEPLTNTYYHHPSYDDYPVVGVSYKQVLSYCKWRTETVMKMLNSYDRQYIDFEYRLPTRTEWELVARGGYTKKQKKHLRKLNKKYGGKYRTCNMIYDDHEGTGYTSPAMIAPSRTYIRNKFKVHNIYGNVAEMVAEPNIAMGGSFIDKYEDIVPSNKALSYEGPQRWLGFRCVAEFYDK